MNDLNHYFINRKITRQKLETFLKKYQTNGYTLDIGCGNKMYKDLFPNSICADIDESKKPDIIVDVHKMTVFQNDTFDCILCTEVLEHCYAPWIAAEEIHRVLKPGGILLLSTRFVYPLHDTPQDYYRFTKYGLQYLFKKFKIIELREETQPFEALGVIYQRLAFQTKTRLPFLRFWWFLVSEVCAKLNFTLSQYGNLNHRGAHENILTSGYYLALQKPDTFKEE